MGGVVLNREDRKRMFELLFTLQAISALLYNSGKCDVTACYPGVQW